MRTLTSDFPQSHPCARVAPTCIVSANLKVGRCLTALEPTNRHASRRRSRTWRFPKARQAEHRSGSSLPVACAQKRLEGASREAGLHLGANPARALLCTPVVADQGAREWSEEKAIEACHPRAERRGC